MPAVPVKCEYCNGSGQIVHAQMRRETCPKCKGRKYVLVAGTMNKADRDWAKASVT